MKTKPLHLTHSFTVWWVWTMKGLPSLTKPHQFCSAFQQDKGTPYLTLFFIYIVSSPLCCVCFVCMQWKLVGCSWLDFPYLSSLAVISLSIHGWCDIPGACCLSLLETFEMFLLYITLVWHHINTYLLCLFQLGVGEDMTEKANRIRHLEQELALSNEVMCTNSNLGVPLVTPFNKRNRKIILTIKLIFCQNRYQHACNVN